MGADDLLFNAVIDGVQLLFYKMRNGSRAKAFGAFAQAEGWTFWQKGKDYTGSLMGDPKAYTGKRRLGSKGRLAMRFFGMSRLGARLSQFTTNELRGDWQTNCNISEGTWNGHTATVYDTLWFDLLGETLNEGEYTSIFVQLDHNLPHMIIAPSGIWSAMGRLAKFEHVWGSHKVQFESATFNKHWHVMAKDKRGAFAVVTQQMMDYLEQHTDGKWNVELANGGILMSNVRVMGVDRVKHAMDFMTGLLDNIDLDLLEPAPAG